MDKQYWKQYYSLNKNENAPSAFAHFVLENYTEPNSSLIELGCGNGRDSIFFARNNIQVLAIDQCEDELLILKKEYNIPNLTFQTGDFTSLGDLGLFDFIYSRFTLHSVSEKEESRTIQWVYQHLNVGGKIFIEVRGKKNELYKLGTPVLGEVDAYIYNNHYRRFVDIETIQKKLKACGFEIISAEERNGFAPFKDTDDTFMRIIAKK